MSNVFITPGTMEWGSTRMRCYWPSKYMQDTEVVEVPDNGRGEANMSLSHDAYIFQKQGNPELQKSLIDSGKKVFLDQCDPMWWFSDQKLMRAMFENAHGAVFSSSELMKDFLLWYGEPYKAITIPDRMEPEHFNKKKVHHWINPVRFIWYGMVQNRVALAAVFANLSRLRVMGFNISLTIMDNYPSMPITETDDIPFLYTKWQLDKEVAQIAAHDVALLPPYPGPWGKVKSNNRNIAAAMCNVPYTTGLDYDELVLLMDHKNREVYSEEQSEGLDKYDVKLSAEEWERFIDAS